MKASKQHMINAQKLAAKMADIPEGYNILELLSGIGIYLAHLLYEIKADDSIVDDVTGQIGDNTRTTLDDLRREL